jgi:hypothetical protein
LIVRTTTAGSPPITVDLLRPYPAEKMTAYEIGRQINKRGYDAPDIVDPALARTRAQPRPSCRSEDRHDPNG